MNANSISAALALWMGNVVVQATVITAAAIFAALLLRRNAAARGWILTSALVLLLAVPGIVLVSQATGSGLLFAAWDGESLSDETHEIAGNSAKPHGILDEGAASPGFDPEAEMLRNGEFFRGASGANNEDATAMNAVASDLAPHNQVVGSLAATESDQAASPSADLSATPAGDNPLSGWQIIVMIAAAVWMVGAVVLLVRWVRGWSRLAGMLRRASPPGRGMAGKETSRDDIPAVLDEVRQTLGTRRGVQLLISAKIDSPLVAGVWRPRIVLPADLTSRVTRSQLREILLHETAHVIRRDPLVAVLQNLAGVLYWFHPLAAVLCRGIRQAREEVCDNYVLSAADSPSYGRTLLQIAEWMNARQPYPATVAFLDGGRRLEARVARILDDQRNRAVRLPRAAAAGVLAVAGMVAGVAAFATVGVAESATVSADNAADSNDEAAFADGATSQQANQAKLGEPQSPQPAVDVYGDPIPSGAVVRLGTIRFRQSYAGALPRMFFVNGEQQIAMYSVPGVFRWWDAETGELKRSVRVEGRLLSRDAALSPDGETLAVIGYHEADPNGAVPYVLQLFDPRTGEKRDEIQVTSPNDRETWSDIAFAPDGRSLVAGSDSGSLAVLDLATKQWTRELQVEAAPASIRSLAVSRDGQTLVYSTDRGLHAWKFATEEQAEFPEIRVASEIAVSPRDGSLAVISRGPSYTDVSLSLWDVEKREVIREFETPPSPNGHTGKLVFSADGNYLMSAVEVHVEDTHWDRFIYVWDVQTGKATRRIDCGETRYYSVDFSPNQDRMVAASTNSVAVWDVETGERIGEIAEAHGEAVERIQFTPDGKQIVSAATDNTARVWDAETGRQLHVLQHDHWVRGMGVSPDGQWIATSSMDDTVRLWNGETGEQVHQWKGNGRYGQRRELRFSADSSTLTSWGDSDPVIRRWNVATGESLSETRTAEQSDSPDYVSESAAILAPGGARIAFFRQNLEILDCVSGETIQTIESDGELFRTGAFSPDGSRMLLLRTYVDPDEEPRSNMPVSKYEYVMINLADKSIAWTYRVTGWRGQLAYSHDGRMVAVTQWRPADEIIHFLNAETGEKLGEVTIDDRLGMINPERMAFAPDGKSFAAALNDSTVLVWNLADVGVELD